MDFLPWFIPRFIFLCPLSVPFAILHKCAWSNFYTRISLESSWFIWFLCLNFLCIGEITIFSPQMVQRDSNMAVDVHIRKLAVPLVDFDIGADHHSNVYLVKKNCIQINFGEFWFNLVQLNSLKIIIQVNY